MSQAAQTTANRPTLLGSGLITIFLILMALKAHTFSLMGNPSAMLGMVALSVAALYWGIRTLTAMDHYRDRLRLRKAMRAMKRNQGEAALGDLKAAEKAGLRTGQGIIAGTVDGEQISLPWPGHIAVAAPPGSGKDRDFLDVNLIANAARKDGEEASHVILDISAESYCKLAPEMERQGYENRVLCADEKGISRRTGRSIVSDHCNPLGFIRPDSPTINEDIDLGLGNFQSGPSLEKETSGNAAHFTSMGEFVAGSFAMSVLARKSEVTPVDLYCISMSSNLEIAKILDTMIESDAFGGVLSMRGKRMQGLLVGSPEEWSGIMSSFCRMFKAYAPTSALGKHVGKSGFHWGELKQKKICLWLICPPDIFESAGGKQWLTSCLGIGTHVLAREPSNRGVIFWLNEIGNIPKVNGLASQMSTYRKWGLRWVLILQTVSSQLESRYGKEEARQILEVCDSLLAFGLRSPEDLKRCSDLAGTRSVADGSHSLSADGTSDGELSYTGSHKVVPLLRREAIRELPNEKALLFHKNAPPFIVDRINSLQDPEYRDKLAPNPYYQ